MDCTTDLLEGPCNEEQAREVREVFGEVDEPTVYMWVLAGLARRAHDGNASAARELRALTAEADKRKRADRDRQQFDFIGTCY